MTSGDSSTQRTKKKGEKTKEQARESKTRVPARLLVGAWLIPGLGHWLLGKKKRAIVFAVVIACSFDCAAHRTTDGA